MRDTHLDRRLETISNVNIAAKILDRLESKLSLQILFPLLDNLRELFIFYSIWTQRFLVISREKNLLNSLYLSYYWKPNLATIPTITGGKKIGYIENIYIYCLNHRLLVWIWRNSYISFVAWYTKMFNFSPKKETV